MIKSLCLVTLLCLNTLIISVCAQAVSLVYIDPANKTVTAGQTFTVAISCVPAQLIKSFELKLSFDASLLQANSVTEGNIFQGHTTFFNKGTINNNNGTIINIYDMILGAGTVSNTGTFIIISFTTKSTPGTSILNLYDVGVTNEVGYIPITIQSGNIAIQGTSQTPNTPGIPSGPSSLNVNSAGYYTTTATDPNGDQVQYQFDWDAVSVHQYSGWTSLVPSGQSASMSHSWSSTGTYLVRAQAKDSHGNVGSWSNGLTVTVSTQNNPPNTPGSPSPANHATSVSVTTDLSWAGGDPDSGDIVTYDVYFGSSSNPLKVSSNQASTSYNIGTLSNNMHYYWEIIAKDNHGATTTGPLWDFTTTSSSNNPPNTPITPQGPVTQLTGASGTYSTSAVDPNNDQVQYQFDWNAGGTHEYSGWTSLVASGQSVSISHSWSNTGTYLVCAQARDEHGSVSAWSTGLTVTVTGGTKISDQASTRYDNANSIWSTHWCAQSFTPSLKVLKKVTLYIGKMGSPSSDLVVSVRSSLNGADLTSVVKSSGSIPSRISWVVCDFKDISVTPGRTYYLVVRTSGGTSVVSYMWGYGKNNPYPKGSFRMSANAGSSWTEYTAYDFCFITY